MDIAELIGILSRGEDGKHQFKEKFSNADALAAEMVAFSNSQGGKIIIGAADDGRVTGLTPEDIRGLNQLVSNTAAHNVQPPIHPVSENIELPDGVVMVVEIQSGINKPYMDNKGNIWIKSGADKRKAASREELQRMFQSSGLVHGDETPANGIGLGDLDLDYFSEFYYEQSGEPIDESEHSLKRILLNMNLMKEEQLNVAGALLFTRTPQFRLPAFIVKIVSYPSEDISENEYTESADITGKLIDIYRGTMAFIQRNIRRTQRGRGVNSQGEFEIPMIVFEELVVNALIHRDYFISAPVRIFIFNNRIEIISPGHLPNNLTIENIKNGNSNMRNPILASFASKIMPYRGLGNGIRRALNAYPDIDFDDNRDGNLFKVTIRRKDFTA